METDTSIVKKGRGRPKGSKNKPKEGALALTTQPEGKMFTTSSTDVVVNVPKQRGRPKGSKNNKKRHGSPERLEVIKNIWKNIENTNEVE